MSTDRVTPDLAARRLTIVVSMALFVDMIVYGVVVPMLPSVARELHLSSMATGILLAGYPIALVVVTPALGMLTDRVGARMPLLLGLIALGLTTGIYAFAHSYTALFAARCLQGVAAAATWTAGLALLAEGVPRQTRGKAMGTALAAIGAGSLVGPALGGILLDWGGRLLPFAVAGGLAIADAVLRVLWIPSAESQRISRISDFSELATTTTQPNPVEATHNSALLLDPRIQRIAWIVLISATAFAALEPTLPFHLQVTLKTSPTTTGLFFAASTLCSALVSPWVGARVDKGDSPWPWMIGGGLVMGGVMVSLSIAFSLPRVFVGLLLLGISSAAMTAPTLGLLAAEVDRRTAADAHLSGPHIVRYGAAYALFNVVYAAGMAIGPLLAGALADRSGFRNTMIVVGIVVIVGVAAVGLSKVQRPQRDD